MICRTSQGQSIVHFVNDVVRDVPTLPRAQPLKTPRKVNADRELGREQSPGVGRVAGTHSRFLSPTRGSRDVAYVEAIYRVATDHDCARDRAVRDGGPQRRASFDGSASCRSRHWAPFPGQQARPHHRRNSCRRRLRQESDAVHGARRRHPASPSARSSICWRPCAALASTTATSRSIAREVPIMDGSAGGLRRGDRRGRHPRALRAAQVHQGSEADPRPGRRLLGRAVAALGLPPRRRDRLPHAADRPPAPGAGDELRRLPQRDLPAPAPSASCATWRASGRPVWRSAPPSTTPSPSADDRIMNREGLRYPQEFVRHKMLDAVGDLALAGAPLLARLPLGARRPSAQLARACRPCSPTRRRGPMVQAPWVREPGRSRWASRSPRAVNYDRPDRSAAGSWSSAAFVPGCTTASRRGSLGRAPSPTTSIITA